MTKRGTENTMGPTLALRRLRGESLRTAIVAGVAAGAMACSVEQGGETLGSTSEAAQPSPVIDARRSLAITEQPILANFGLKRVLDQLIATSGVTGLTATALFQQWWDTQNAPLCSGTLNGYPYACRPAPAEGGQSTCDPFEANSTCAYLPVGLFMRFDLAPEDGSHCGEYRVVFAKESGRFVENNRNRNLLIFEASMRNPHVNQGIRGCEKFVRAWAELSEEDDIDVRRAALEEWYFDGYQEFDPVIRFDAFGENPNSAGQVRTNQFIQPEEPRMWNLREFKLDKDCSTPPCTLRFVAVTNKVNPYGPLFDGTSTHPNAAGFQAEFLTKVAGLASADPNAIGMNTSDVYNSGQSLATGLSTETDYVAQFGPGYGTFGPAIQAKLTALGSTLTPLHIVERAQVTACAGCHRFSSNADLGGVIWPPSLGFTHVSERDVDLETISGVTRFKISDALVNLLLPHRKLLVEDFLNEVPRPAKGPKVPLGGRWVH
jgi:hypothetical protein